MNQKPYFISSVGAYWVAAADATVAPTHLGRTSFTAQRAPRGLQFTLSKRAAVLPSPSSLLSLSPVCTLHISRFFSDFFPYVGLNDFYFHRAICNWHTASCLLFEKSLKITFAFQSLKVGLYVYTQCHKALSFALDQTQLSIALTHF